MSYVTKWMAQFRKAWICLNPNFFFSSVAMVEKIRNSLSISRVLCSLPKATSACHLSCLVVTNKLYRSTPRHRTCRPTCADIHDLSTHKAYGILCCQRTGELLPRLFTLTCAIRHRRLFSVMLLKPCGLLPVKKYGALCCPDFPLICTDERQTDRLHGYKGSHFFLLWKYFLPSHRRMM